MGKKDGKPRGKMSAYAYFVQTCRDELKKKNPNESVVFAEFSKKCGEKWKVLLISYISNVNCYNSENSDHFIALFQRYQKSRYQKKLASSGFLMAGVGKKRKIV